MNARLARFQLAACCFLPMDILAGLDDDHVIDMYIWCGCPGGSN